MQPNNPHLLLLNQKSEEESSSSGSGEELGSQSDDGSEGSVESASGSQEDATTSPLAIGPEAATGTHTEVGAEEEDTEVTSDDTIVLYVNLYKFDLVLRQQLINYFRSIWTVNRSEYFFNNGIVNKSDGFKNRLLMPETILVMADIHDVANPLFERKLEALGLLVVVPHTPIVPPQAEGQTELGESSQQPASGAPSLPPASTSQAISTFINLPTTFLEKLFADQRQTKTLVDQIVHRMPQLIERNVLAMFKRLKDEMRKEFAILKK
ncbi:hypothetical protein KY290_013594 [Solanum tuberosum]|uniref:Uncharacterized protein n=1 Tax=Solanum tuberosum TaxID=4113 RepID=A0ABQ7VMF0_SOLTU|nr:hypothetical protein KY289_013721 [Solanum tuberosum]KAH0717041.1 hypothetical protein KY285_013072 [Solanum tuberosum]KAH0769613.1 hypothetical protein KY290_013594 [Solanum tuberosum]